MTYGLSDNDLAVFQHTVIAPLQDAGARVWVFGSRARGNHRPFSDIDVLYAFPAGTLPPTGLIASIAEAAENSRLSIKVDLVSVDALAAAYRDGVMADRIAVNP